MLPTDRHGRSKRRMADSGSLRHFSSFPLAKVLSHAIWDSKFDVIFEPLPRRVERGRWDLGTPYLVRLCRNVALHSRWSTAKEKREINPSCVLLGSLRGFDGHCRYWLSQFQPGAAKPPGRNAKWNPVVGEESPTRIQCSLGFNVGRRPLLFDFCLKQTGKGHRNKQKGVQTNIQYWISFMGFRVLCSSNCKKHTIPI